jgi:hypothetical protein
MADGTITGEGIKWILAVKVLFRATPTATRDLGLYCVIRRTGIPVRQWDSNRGRKDQQIFEPPLRHAGLHYIHQYIFITSIYSSRTNM